MLRLLKQGHIEKGGELVGAVEGETIAKGLKTAVGASGSPKPLILRNQVAALFYAQAVRLS